MNDEIVDWITVKGNHIPIMKGWSKKDNKVNHSERISKILDTLDYNEKKFDNIIERIKDSDFDGFGYSDLRSIVASKAEVEEFVNKQPALERLVNLIYNDEIKLTNTFFRKIGNTIKAKDTMKPDEWREKMYHVLFSKAFS